MYFTLELVNYLQLFQINLTQILSKTMYIEINGFQEYIQNVDGLFYPQWAEKSYIMLSGTFVFLIVIHGSMGSI
jgi:hypothetical protein